MVSPQLSIIDEKGTTQVNSTYKEWSRKDQMVLSPYLLNIESALYTEVGKETAKEAWNELIKNHASESRSRIIELQARLHNSQKGMTNLDEYIQYLRTIADNLGKQA